MRLAYPASHIASRLTDSLLSLKIARHSPCSICISCPGLHPPPGVDIILDEPFSESSLGGLEQYGSDDDDITSSYLELCACGHDAKQHNADESELGKSEFARRSRVAIRLDELLQDSGRLLDFDYDDDDIKSLRLQMSHHTSSIRVETNSSPDQLLSVPLSPASSALSDIPLHQKKRRASSSSLSDADENDDEEDEEEDRPLAARMATGVSGSRVVPGRRSGKQAPGKKSKKSHTAPASLLSSEDQINGKINGVNGHEHKIKVEEKLDEGQLTRLAAGVTVDSVRRSSAGPPVRTEKASVIELRKGVIQIMPVENDKQPRSLIILTGLKTLFQKQLPKMPREYIARLVYDSNSKALGIVKRGFKVVGGICYRPFPHRGFAEIVFFATNSVDQEKGYGGMLMDHFKAHIRQTYPEMMHFLTYADNYAVGYFEKQGFSKDITLDRSVWAGYIKDYEGGTIMQCTMLRKVNYVDKASFLARQQEAIMAKVRQMSKSHIVHPGLPQFQPGAGPNVTVDPKDVPGLRESGWTPTMTTNTARTTPKNADHYFMERLLKDLQDYPQAWAFLHPVNGDDVPDYYDVIKNPMDFSTMEHKLETNQYTSIEEFSNDAQLVFDNCRLYNPENSIYARNATKVEKFFKELVQDRVRRDD